MKTIKVTVTTGFVGAKREDTFEIDDDATDEEIEDTAQEAMFNMIEWSWSVVGDE